MRKLFIIFVFMLSYAISYAQDFKLPISFSATEHSDYSVLQESKDHKLGENKLNVSFDGNVIKCIWDNGDVLINEKVVGYKFFDYVEGKHYGAKYDAHYAIELIDKESELTYYVVIEKRISTIYPNKATYTFFFPTIEEAIPYGFEEFRATVDIN